MTAHEHTRHAANALTPGPLPEYRAREESGSRLAGGGENGGELELEGGEGAGLVDVGRAEGAGEPAAAGALHQGEFLFLGVDDPVLGDAEGEVFRGLFFVVAFFR